MLLCIANTLETPKPEPSAINSNLYIIDAIHKLSKELEVGFSSMACLFDALTQAQIKITKLHGETWDDAVESRNVLKIVEYMRKEGEDITAEGDSCTQAKDISVVQWTHPQTI